MNQKKALFGILGLIAVAAIYYFAIQSIQANKKLEQVIKLKQQVNAQLTEIRSNGFSLSNRETGKEKEQFYIRLDDPEKASAYLTQKGIRVTVEDAKELKGLKLAVDLAYLSDIISLDLYPVILPTQLHSILIQENDKNILEQIKEMLQKKIFFAHIDVDHSATTFKGYIKDINEALEGTKEVKVVLKGFHFSGNIKDEKIVKLTQTLKAMHLYMQGEIDRTIDGMQHRYVLTGPTIYDYTEEYSIEKIKMNEAPEAELLAENIFMHSTSRMQNGLAEERLQTKIKNIDLLFEKERLGMKAFFLDMNISNIDIQAFETLQKTDPTDKKVFNALSEKILSNNIHIDIPMLAVEKMTLRGKEIDGFTLHSNIDIESSLDMSRFVLNPKHALSKMDATMELSLSKELLALIKEEPEAMLLYMMYRPKRESDKRIYDIHLKDGLMKINGKDLKINGKAVKF